MNCFRKRLYFIKRIPDFFMNLKIGTKMLTGYIIIILIPVTVLGINFYMQIEQNITNKYISAKQQLIEQSYSNFKGKILQLESLYQLFQFNASAMNFINGYYTSEAEEMYVYIKDIKPLFAYVNVSNNFLDDITIYKYNHSMANYSHDILNISQLKGGMKIVNAIPPGKGMWIFNDQKDNYTLSFYKKFYNSDFSKEVGFLKLTVKSSNLLELFNSNKENGYFLLNKDNDWYLYDNKGMNRISDYSKLDVSVKEFIQNMVQSKKKNSSLQSNVIVNSLKIQEIDTQVYIITPKNSIINNNNDYLILINFAILLIALSFVYYIIVTSVTKRLVKLAKHMRKTDHDNLISFNEPGYKDEIGFLTTSYNVMVSKINTLINSVFKAELKKKEADFYALQAQIKPHFLYNSLETIRMMAEANDDIPVADVIYSLGRFIRYNMSKRNDETQLINEIDNVKNYMQIYRVSMGERLSFSIEINAEIDRCKCPGFILQPVVENCLHHGLSSARKTLIVAVSVSEDVDNIIIKIFDNGIGIDQDKLKTIQEVLSKDANPSELQKKENGIGIVNVNERIKSYFGEQFGLCMESNPGIGTTCIIRLGKRGRVVEFADIDC